MEKHMYEVEESLSENERRILQAVKEWVTNVTTVCYKGMYNIKYVTYFNPVIDYYLLL